MRDKVLHQKSVRAWTLKHKNDPDYKKKNIKRTMKNYHRNKKIVFNHYGHKCTCCGEDTYEFLTVDHINGGGTKHRRVENIKSIYLWLIQNNFPDGFQILCYNCNCGKRANKQCPHKTKGLY